MKKIATVIIAAMMAGCAATPSDFTAYELSQAGNVKLYAAGEPAPSHQALGRVESNSCDSRTTARYAGDRTEAELLLKLETVRRGGDIVVGYTCGTKAVDWVSNCWASQRCQGVAAKAK